MQASLFSVSLGYGYLLSPQSSTRTRERAKEEKWGIGTEVNVGTKINGYSSVDHL